VLLTTDLEGLHGSLRDASCLGELNDGQICQGTCRGELKASQDQAETNIVPCHHMPKACQALEAWAAVVKREAGEAVFRAVNQWQHISAERLTDRSVARIVKSRVKELVKQRGRTAEELVDLISGHSLRAGYATSAAARNMPAYRTQSHTRHKAAQVVAGYIREADTSQGLMVWGSESIVATMRAPPFLVVVTSPADCTWRAATG
jgi:hypothetical protein